jgi:hypothetical protein
MAAVASVNDGKEAVMAAAATGLPARAKSLFMRAEVAEAAGELHQALKLYDQGVREATSSLRGNPDDTSAAIAAVDGYLLRKTALSRAILAVDASLRGGVLLVHCTYVVARGCL